jgi:ATP-dependent protease ClpP protease subunit
MVNNSYEFKFTNKTANHGEIFIYGPIGFDFFGDGISADTFRKELRRLGAIRTLDLHIDSPGGSVTDARAIYSLLIEHKATITGYIDGYAASAASFLIMAADTVKIAEGGFFMIHEARGVTSGTAADMDKAAMLLRTINGQIADTYAARTNIPRSEMLTLMAEETWFTGQEAMDKGFADELIENKRLAACSWPDQFKNLPPSLRPKRAKVERIAARIKQAYGHV